mmetsp:Transcript_36123/g.84590  ORF Transcript_36123/g.84590 Transcript_36123/m.84590 type:complete len:502 (+) Transcript_36123:184-1689(+)|eukprot:CAMPEP_0114119928 /NCGR_PEP_ID=MMETSP0043_2-20121206/6372_1 /TAXON_ID=464988 /ORGANISM="Hemiselmis andersenii, Strain CCMP644" /LENGTH=501 /DNA_ID=CAMNT_0001212507 /DNA_START=100 /DNA_END=1605 /DNA_ORIENTATION=-
MAELDLRSLDEALPVLLPECDLSKRSVGVVERDDGRIQPGYTLISAGRETYLLDEDGRVVHEWRSSRQVFVSYLLPNGNLLRDGSDNDEADLFRLGGAAGFVEEVTWDNERVWSFSKFPMNTFLTHHDLEPMPNGNVLVMCWNRGRRVDGRRKELMPDGEVWDNVVIELKPDGRGGAEAVWSWSFFDHLVQEVNTHCDFTCARGSPKDYPERMDINFCPAGGKHGTRNKNVLLSDREKRSRDMRHTAGRTAYEDTPGKTGEKDWLHCNSVSYCPKRDHVLISINVLCEIIVVKRGVTKEDGTQDLHQRQTGILWRWGNPTSYQCGTRMDQKLFAQHYANFIEEGLPGAGNVLVFNNGRAPDRLWSTVDEITPPETAPFQGEYHRVAGQAFGPKEPCWSFGQRLGRRDSFFCSHISSAHRLPNGNTLICQGPQGIVFEVTREGDEVWRYINPVCNDPNTIAVTRQGDSRTAGRYSLFLARKYTSDFKAFEEKTLVPGRYLEG